MAVHNACLTQIFKLSVRNTSNFPRHPTIRQWSVGYTVVVVAIVVVVGAIVVVGVVVVMGAVVVAVVVLRGSTREVVVVADAVAGAVAAADAVSVADAVSIAGAVAVPLGSTNSPVSGSVLRGSSSSCQTHLHLSFRNVFIANSNSKEFFPVLYIG